MGVFLSYHSSRLATAEHLAAYLGRHGIATWYAPRDVPPGSTWSEAIAGAIQSSSALILLFCADADRSQQVQREINLADRAGIPIYWLRLETVEPERLQYFLNATQWVDWLDERDSTLDQIIDALEARRVMSGAPAPASSDKRTEATTSIGPWPRRVLVMAGEREAAEVAARILMMRAQMEPDSSVVLPTGRAATHVFRAILRVAGEFGEAPFGEAHLITDTETFGVWPGHDTSRTRHVTESLIEPLRDLGFHIASERIHLLTGLITEIDPIRAAARTIRLWPPAVHAVSVAPSGEVLAYEVGMYTDPDDVVSDGPKVIELSEYGRGYIDATQPSKSVLSIGMGTCLAAATLLVLAFDPAKANILRQMVTGPETAGVPATLLRRHANAYALTTQRTAERAGLDDIAHPITVTEAVALIKEDH